MATSSQMHPYKKHLMQSQHLNFDNMGTQFQSSMKEANSDLSGKKENSRYDHNQKLSSAALPKRTANQFIPNEHSRTSSAPLASSSNNNSHEGADLALAPPPHPRLHSSHSNSVTSLGSTPTNSSSLGALRQTSSNTSLTIEQKNKRTRSVDLSHMYLLNSSNDTQMTATNESVADLSHQMISRYLGGRVTLRWCQG